MSLLTLCRSAADRIGIPQPPSLVGTSDQQSRLILSYATQEGIELSRRHPWQVLVKEHTFQTVDGTVAYSLPSDFDRVIEGSIWNRTQSRRLVGPISAQRWQMLQAQSVSTSWQAFYIRGNYFRISPTPSATETIAYEYVSSWWCGTASDTSPTAAAWADDTDEPFLDEELITLGVVWRFLRGKGLDYSEAFRTYEDQVTKRIAHDGGQRMLDLSNEPGTSIYEPYVEDGNWTI